MLKMLKEFFMGIDFQHSTGLSVEDTKSNMEKLFEQEATKEIFNGKVTDNKINFAFTEGRQKAFGVKGLGVIFVKNDKTFLKTKIFCGSGPRVMASIWILALTYMFVGSILRASNDGSWYFPVGVLALYFYGFHLLKQWFEPVNKSQKQFEEEVKKVLS